LGHHMDACFTVGWLHAEHHTNKLGKLLQQQMALVPGALSSHWQVSLHMGCLVVVPAVAVSSLGCPLGLSHPPAIVSCFCSPQPAALLASEFALVWSNGTRGSHKWSIAGTSFMCRLCAWHCPSTCSGNAGMPKHWSSQLSAQLPQWMHW
jgi:hypothetical protein